MQISLDDKKNYEKYDPALVGESIELLPKQISHLLEQSRSIKIPNEYKNCHLVVVSGMGGSNIGARIVKTAFKHISSVPILIEPGYEVPAYVNKNTLFILSSYSGTTEETLSTYKEAKKRGAKILAISSQSENSALAKLMIKDSIPGIIFEAKNNPSGQPRMALGYSIFSFIVLLNRAGLFPIKIKDIEKMIVGMEARNKKLIPEYTHNNIAKKIAKEILGKTPTLVAAEHLTGNIKALRNQMSENSKLLPSYLELPDLNHYAMEGLGFPENNNKNKIFLLFDSKLYAPRIQKRSELTKQIIKKNKIGVISYTLQSQDKLSQNFELLQLGVWITYYLGILHKIDPSKIPFVDWFKEQLK